MQEEIPQTLRRIWGFVGLNFFGFLVANSKKTTNISHN